MGIMNIVHVDVQNFISVLVRPFTGLLPRYQGNQVASMSYVPCVGCRVWNH